MLVAACLDQISHVLATDTLDPASSSSHIGTANALTAGQPVVAAAAVAFVSVH